MAIGRLVLAWVQEALMNSRLPIRVGKWSLFAIIAAGHRHRHHRHCTRSVCIAIKTERSELRNPPIGIHDTWAYRECFDTHGWKRDISQDKGWTIIEKTTLLHYTCITLIDDSELKSDKFKICFIVMPKSKFFIFSIFNFYALYYFRFLYVMSM